jgi:hypothetical protein
VQARDARSSPRPEKRIWSQQVPPLAVTDGDGAIGGILPNPLGRDQVMLEPIGLMGFQRHEVCRL